MTDDELIDWCEDPVQAARHITSLTDERDELLAWVRHWRNRAAKAENECGELGEAQAVIEQVRRYVTGLLSEGYLISGATILRILDGADS